MTMDATPTPTPAPTSTAVDKSPYPVAVHHMRETDAPSYYLAYLIDFGWTACSATADTEAGAIEAVREVEKEVVAHLKAQGVELPQPTVLPSDAKTQYVSGEGQRFGDDHSLFTFYLSVEGVDKTTGRPKHYAVVKRTDRVKGRYVSYPIRLHRELVAPLRAVGNFFLSMADLARKV